MKHGKNFRLMPAVLMSAMIFTSCTIWNPKQWQRLENRTFYFQKFTYYLKGGDKKTALGFMKDFPIDAVLSLAEKKYGISIDRTGFSAFRSGGDESPIKAFGVILPERFTWETGRPDSNSVEFEYENRFIEDSTEVRRFYKLTIKSGGRIRAVHGESVPDMAGVIKSLSLKLVPE